MTLYYVTMTWDNWPEGGSYGDIVDAPSSDQAVQQIIVQMSESRYNPELDDDPADPAAKYGDEWHVVDCWELDAFITRNMPEPRTKTEPWGQGWYWSEGDDNPCYGPFETKDDARIDWLDEPEDRTGRVEFAQMTHPSICCDVFSADTVLEDLEERNEEAHWYEAPPEFKPEDCLLLEQMLADTLRRWLETSDRKKEFLGLVGWRA